MNPHFFHQYFFVRKYKQSTSIEYFYVYHTNTNFYDVLEAKRMIGKKYGISVNKLRSINTYLIPYRGVPCRMYSFRVKSTSSPVVPKVPLEVKVKKDVDYPTPKIIPNYTSDAVLRVADVVQNPMALIQERSSGSLKNRAILLNDDYIWKIIRDDKGSPVLYAIKRNG
jgi:hypothetical protein